MDPNQSSDAAPGEGPLWDAFIERFRRLVHAVCFRILRRGEDAENAVQETWKRVVRNRRTYTGGDPLRVWATSSAPKEDVDPDRARQPVAAWLARIARNAAIDLQRRSAVR